MIRTHDPMGRRKTFMYDHNDNMTLFEDYGQSQPDIMDYTFCNRLAGKYRGDRGNRYFYDLKGNLIRKIDPHGHEVLYTYDAIGNCLTESAGNETIYYTYNALGLPIVKRDGLGYETKTTYNSRGSPISITHPDGTKESYTYTDDGQLSSYTNENGVTTKYRYDPFGNLLEKVTGEKKEVYEYDKGNLIRKHDPYNHITHYLYDSLGRKTSKTKDGVTKSYVYDSLGRVAQKQKEDLVTRYTYDLLDRVIKKDVCGEEWSYTYDRGGNLSSETRRGTTNYIYDTHDRLIKMIDPLRKCYRLYL